MSDNGASPTGTRHTILAICTMEALQYSHTAKLELFCAKFVAGPGCAKFVAGAGARAICQELRDLTVSAQSLCPPMETELAQKRLWVLIQCPAFVLQSQLSYVMMILDLSSLSLQPANYQISMPSQPMTQTSTIQEASVNYSLPDPLVAYGTSLWWSCTSSALCLS